MPSREEMIAALRAQDQKMPAAPSREDMVKALREQDAKQSDPGMLSNLGNVALEGAVAAGRFVDSYTGAPTRAAIGAVQKGENPLSAAWNQVGENPDLAPTGKQIAQRAGISDKPFREIAPTLFNSGMPAKAIQATANLIPGMAMAAPNLGEKVANFAAESSPAGVAGLGVDIAADPTNLVPGAALAKAGVKAAGKGLSTATKAVVQGTKIERVANSVADTAKATSEALSHIFKPRHADDFKELAAIAKKNGIDPSVLPASVEFGDKSVPSRLERHVREGSAGGPELEKFQNAYFQVQDATNQKFSKVSGLAHQLDEIDAGKLIRQGYDNAVDRLFQDVDFTYSAVIDQSPGIRLTQESADAIGSKLGGLEKWAKGQAKRGITNTEREQASQILRAVEAVREGNGSLKQTYEAMSQIGRHAFKTGNSLQDIPVDQKKFQELYFALRNEFVNSTAKQLGPDVAERLILSNQLISDFNKNKASLASILGNKQVAPEAVFNRLIKSGDSQKIGDLKALLSAEEFNQLKGAFLESLAKRNTDGTLSFRNLHSALRNKKSVASSLFEPDEAREIAELIKLGDRFGEPFLSTSGTGASGVFRDLREGVESGVANRAVLAEMKNAARGRAAKPQNPLQQKQIPLSKQATTRTRTDVAAKVSQVAGAQTATGQEEPKTGTEKWAADGLAKLKRLDPAAAEILERVRKDPKAQGLLYMASDAEPGSPALKKIMERIKREYGKANPVR